MFLPQYCLAYGAALPAGFPVTKRQGRHCDEKTPSLTGEVTQPIVEHRRALWF
jgi:hypothetical protein